MFRVNYRARGEVEWNDLKLRREGRSKAGRATVGTTNPQIDLTSRGKPGREVLESRPNGNRFTRECSPVNACDTPSESEKLC